MEQACILNLEVRVQLKEISAAELTIGSHDKDALRSLATTQTNQLQKTPVSLMTPTSYQEEEFIAASQEEGLQDRNCLYYVVTKTGIILSFNSRGK